MTYSKLDLILHPQAFTESFFDRFTNSTGQDKLVFRACETQQIYFSYDLRFCVQHQSPTSVVTPACQMEANLGNGDKFPASPQHF